MVHVVFAIPFAMENTLRFARATAALPGVRLSVLSQETAAKFPSDFVDILAGFQQVGNALNVKDVVGGVQALAAKLGPCERLLGILEQAQEALAATREQLRIRGMDAPTARNFRDKARMKDLFAANGLPCARHQLVASLEQGLRFADEVAFPLVGKPPAGAGSKATSRCDNAAELRTFLQQCRPSPGNEVLLEEFVLGREFSFDTVTLHGRPVFHNICAYHPTPLEVMENPWIQWAVVLPRSIDEPEFRDIHRTGPRALSVLGMWTGMSHMEWFRRHDGSIAIGEVAARPPGAQFMTLISHVTGADMYRVFAELMVFETFEPLVRHMAVGCAYLRGQGGGKEPTAVTAVHGVDAVRKKLGDLIVDARLPTLGKPPSTSYEGDGYMIVRHPDTEVVTAAVREIVRTVRVELG